MKKIRKDNEGKEKRKADREQRKIKNNIGCKRGGVRTRGGLTHQRTQRLPIKTRWGKQGSSFRPADKEIKEYRIQFELFIFPEDGHKRPSSNRNVKVPLNLHFQQNTKVALNTKRARRRKIGNVRNVKGMKFVQMNTFNVTSVPCGTINGAQQL